jgi:ABC-2 type transport system ATP-binding protein
MTQSTNALEVVNLRVTVKPHFWSRRRELLRGVSLTVAPGEIFGFLGPNGAGKTTTIKSILGLMRPSAGRIQVLGGAITDPNIRARLGFMPERAYFSERLTGREVVLQHALLAGLSPKRARERCAEVLHEVGLHGAERQLLGSYSKGMLQRVSLAQAIVADPDLVVLDEPQSGLDPIGRRDIRNIMLKLRGLGKTVFFSTHILPDVEMICDRVAILVAGEVRQIGALSTLLGKDAAVAGIEVVAHGGERGLTTQAAALGVTVEPVRAMQPLRFLCPTQAKADELISLLRRSGASIEQVTTHRLSLEDVFMSEALDSQAQEPAAARGTP